MVEALGSVHSTAKNKMKSYFKVLRRLKLKIN
jgi:hypothetical protein